MSKGPYLPDINSLIAAGIDPKTGLPWKIANCEELKNSIKKILRVNDEQAAINRFRWFNLPGDIDSQLMERILYYKGQGAFFYEESFDRFFFLPYALNGEIDVYGRYTSIVPLPFNGQSTNSKEKDKPWIPGLVRVPQYGILMDITTYEDVTTKCVLLNDYSKQLSQTVIPRQILNEGIIDVESEMIPFMRTALQNSTGVQGMRVTSQDEASNVIVANNSVNHASLVGDKYVPIVGQIDFQSLTEGPTGRADEFLMAMQSLDNFRLGTMGIENGGIFQKKAHMLQDEQNMNAGAVSPQVQDGLTLRHNFCNVVNSIWGLNIWCDVSEPVNGMDTDGNGFIVDERDQSGVSGGELPPQEQEVSGDVE